MNAIAELKRVDVMDWNKYTIDGWLEQFGAWCHTERLRGGDLPDGLHINQIYWLMREADKEPRKSKSYISCEITDFEADQIQLMLRSVLKRSDYLVQFALVCLIKHKVEGQSLQRVADATNQSKQKALMMISCARFHLNGYDKRLLISS